VKLNHHADTAMRVAHRTVVAWTFQCTGQV